VTDSAAYNEEILRLTAILRRATHANVDAIVEFRRARAIKKAAQKELRDARRALNDLLLGKVAAAQIPLSLHTNGASDLSDLRRRTSAEG
jgi:exonuclease VII small subunit